MQNQTSLYVLVVCAVLFASQANCARRVVPVPTEKAGPIVEIMSACIKETKNDPEKIMASIKENRVIEDDSFKKFIDCTFQKSGYSNSDGTLNINKSLALFPKDVDMKTVFENCNKDKGNTRLETTFKVYKCYQKTSPVQLAF